MLIESVITRDKHEQNSFILFSHYRSFPFRAASVDFAPYLTQQKHTTTQRKIIKSYKLCALEMRA